MEAMSRRKAARVIYQFYRSARYFVPVRLLGMAEGKLTLEERLRFERKATRAAMCERWPNG